jgi:hypothetical protein
MMNVSAALYAAEQAERSEATKQVTNTRKRLQRAIDDLDAGVSTGGAEWADVWRIGRRKDADDYKPGY